MCKMGCTNCRPFKPSELLDYSKLSYLSIPDRKKQWIFYKKNVFLIQLLKLWVQFNKSQLYTLIVLPYAELRLSVHTWVEEALFVHVWAEDHSSSVGRPKCRSWSI